MNDDKEKTTLEEIGDLIAYTIACFIVIGLGITFLVGLIKLCIWIWRV